MADREARLVPRLHVLTEPHAPDDVVALVQPVLAAGAPCVQLRAKGLEDRAHLELAREVTERCHAHGARCIVNDRVDIALACGADGVHVGAQDLPVAEVRRLAGDGLLVGGTARDPRSARRLAAEGADYLGVGPVYATTTKDGLPEPLGPARLGEVAASVGIPVVAISGITLERVGEVLAAGAHGVAVVGAVAYADDPAAATRSLLERLGGPTSAVRS